MHASLNAWWTIGIFEMLQKTKREIMLTGGIEVVSCSLQCATFVAFLLPPPKWHTSQFCSRMYLFCKKCISLLMILQAQHHALADSETAFGKPCKMVV